MFAEKFLELCNNNPQFLSKILFSDEVNFYLNGVVSNTHFRIWSCKNPHTIVEKSLHAPKVSVWLAFSEEFSIKPYFFDGNVDGEKYRDMITTHLIPQLRTKRMLSNCIYQQYGATPHTAGETIQLLQHHFPGRLISSKSDFEWPSNSPDLNPLDYFLWGYVKQKVYITEVNEALETVPQFMLAKAINSVSMRLLLCETNNGGHFENEL